MAAPQAVRDALRTILQLLADASSQDGVRIGFGTPGSVVPIPRQDDLETGIAYDPEDSAINTGINAVADFFYDTLSPIGTIRFVNTLAAIPDGWQIADGSNGTPNLIGRYFKAAATAGGTGGAANHSHTVNSHTHSMQSHTHSMQNHFHSMQNHVHGQSAHAHNMPIGFDDGSEYWIGNASDLPLYGSVVFTARRSTQAKAAEVSAPARAALTQVTTPPATNGPSTANTGSPSNNTTGGPSSANTGGSSPGTNTQSNDPLFYEVIPIIRVA